MTAGKNSYDKITPTADLISYFRGFSDIPFAKEIADMIGAEKSAKNILKENFESSLYIAVMAEARYKRIDTHAKDYKNILEIGVGRSPRDLILTENPDVTYVSTDLPESLEQHKIIISEIMKQHGLKRRNLHYLAANALELEELKKADMLLPLGPEAIISEGFMVYLPIKEKKVFLENTRELLNNRDGALITTDVMFLQNIKNPIFDAITLATDRDMRNCSFTDEVDARRFFDDLGYGVEIFLDAVELASIKKLGLENDPRSQRLAKSAVWVLKLKK